MRTLLFTVLVFVSTLACSQSLARFELNLSEPAGISTPVSINLDELVPVTDSSFTLLEIQGEKTVPIAFQIRSGQPRILCWMINADDKHSSKRTYQLIRKRPGSFEQIRAERKDGSLTVRTAGKNLLRYQFGTVYPPAGIDTNFKRSGFIHPLWTPHGQPLTRIQAPDHYHHYGIWNPWTHVLFEKDTVDFWNLKEKKGTVRFARFTSVVEGPVYAEFEALHEHVVFKKDGTEKTAINELQTVRVYKPESNNDYYIVDIVSTMNCASASPVLLLTYRYGGLGWRATEFWNDQNSEVLSSDGKTRKDADGSKARWVIVQGQLNDDYGGAALLSDPSNYNHPEPLRIWPSGTNGRGDMFVNFSPTKDKDWLLEPGKSYVLKYRLLVFNGKFDPAKAENAWKNLAMPPVVKVIK